MKDSLRESMAQAVDAYVTNSREDWVVEWPGQVVIAASTVHWTTEVSQVWAPVWLRGAVIPSKILHSIKLSCDTLYVTAKTIMSQIAVACTRIVAFPTIFVQRVGGDKP